jgi:hypothetical protein
MAVGGPGLLVRLAGLADSARLCTAQLQWLCQKLHLPLCPARLHPKALVLGVGQAQQVAMAQNKTLSIKEEHRRIGQTDHAGLRQERRARQKVAVAVHEVHGQAMRCGFQGGAALGFETAGCGDGVIAHPHLEQIAQDEQGVGLRGEQVVLERGHGGRFAGLQVQVGNEIDRAPVRRSCKLFEPGHGRGHGGRCQIRAQPLFR